MPVDDAGSDGSNVVRTVRCGCCGGSVKVWESFRCLECLGRFCEACMGLLAWRGLGLAGYRSGGMCRSCGCVVCQHDSQASLSALFVSDSPPDFLSLSVGREILPASSVAGSRRFRRRSHPPEV